MWQVKKIILCGLLSILLSCIFLVFLANVAHCPVLKWEQGLCDKCLRRAFSISINLTPQSQLALVMELADIH